MNSMLSNASAKQQQSQHSYSSFQQITSFHKVTQTSRINLRLLSIVSPRRTWLLGITELMKGCNGLKEEGSGMKGEANTGSLH